MEEKKRETDHLHKQVKDLRIALMLTQATMIVSLIILGSQYLQLLQKYQNLLKSVNLCLESVNTVYLVLQQLLLAL